MEEKKVMNLKESLEGSVGRFEGRTGKLCEYATLSKLIKFKIKNLQNFSIQQFTKVRECECLYIAINCFL